ncbi:MAG: efflux RND transporter permease subunit [Bacteroidales bacterium]
MTLSELSIKRPVLTIVFAIVIVLFGISAFMSLGVREYPSVDPPIITIRTDYPGTNAEIIESQITEPLEEQINRVNGIKTITASSSTGRSTIRAEFELSMDLDNAANDIRDRVSQAVRSLPPDADPPVVSKADADAQTIFTVTLQSQQKNLLELTEIADNIFAERLQTIEGVSQTYIWGEKQYAMRLKLDPQRMKALKITTSDIRNALNEQNLELPSGQIEGEEKYITIQTYGRINTEEEFNNLIIGTKDKRLIRLQDVGYAELSAINNKTLLRGNKGIPMVGVALVPQSGANYIEIVDEARRQVEMIENDIEEDITLGIGLDITDSIRRSINDVEYTILIAFVLVLFIIFIFLRDVRTTLIPVLAIPISLIGSFVFLYTSGFSINILSLLGLLLATGMVVDDAIVMTENIYSKIEQGMSPIQAAFKGSRQVFFAIIATTITLVSVFLPIFFMQGFTGRLFREFAMVIAGSVIISTFISLSLTVMMSSRILKQQKQGKIRLGIIQKFIEYILTSYRGWLISFMKVKYLALPVILISAVIIWLLMVNLPSELAPLDDKSGIRIISNAPEGTSYEMMDDYQNQLVQLLDTIPEKEYMLSVTSPRFGSSVSANSGFLRLMLLPPDERDKSQMELAGEIQKMLQEYNMAQTIVTQNPTIESAGGGRGQPVQYVLQATTLDKLENYLPQFMEAARKSPALSMVETDLQFNKPELIIDINRERAKDMGINVRDIAETLQTFYSEQRLGYFIKNGKQYFVVSEAERKFRNQPEDLGNIYVKNNNNEMVSLDNLVNYSEESMPPQLLRFNRFSSATISATPAEGYTLGESLTALDEIADNVLDESFMTSLTGSSADYTESSGSLLLVFIFALLLIFLTLSGQFESFRDPLVIMLTVPLALAGALLSLWAFGLTLNIFSQIGMIVLIGIVTKNGILLVEFANQKRQEGQSRTEAAINAASDRVRPILMTSLATALGAIPLAISFGDTANSRMPMGIAIIGGLLFALILTLFIIPALYTYISGKTKKQEVEENE